MCQDFEGVSGAWLLLGMEREGGTVDGKDYTEQQCYQKALEFDPKNATAWVCLGGAKIDSKDFEHQCVLRSLEYDPRQPWAWFRLGNTGGGKIDGEDYSKQQCFQKSLELDRKDGFAWFCLGNEGGGKIGSTDYSKQQCYEHALEVIPKHTVAWFNLALQGGGTVSGKDCSKLQCYQTVLQLDPKHASSWTNLGNLGGGEISGKSYSEQQCLQKALEFNPKHDKTWLRLGFIGGGKVGGTDYTQLQCYKKVLDMDPKHCKAWFHLGLRGGCNFGGRKYSAGECFRASNADGKIFEQIALQKTRHEIEFRPDSSYRPGANVVASFPGKYGAIWDMVQGRGGTKGGTLLQMSSLSFLEAQGEVAPIQTCCVFLPKGTAEHGHHDKQQGDNCWCRIKIEDGGLEYVVKNGAEWKASNCLQKDIVEGRGHATFGCLWYKVWQEQVKAAQKQKCKFYAVIPDVGHGEPGFSQRGEMAYLQALNDKNEVDYKVLCVSDFMKHWTDFQ